MARKLNVAQRKALEKVAREAFDKKRAALKTEWGTAKSELTEEAFERAVEKFQFTKLRGQIQRTRTKLVQLMAEAEAIGFDYMNDGKPCGTVHNGEVQKFVDDLVRRELAELELEEVQVDDLVTKLWTVDTVEEAQALMGIEVS